VSSFIVQALRNQDITIFGEGTQTRSFCYVDDMVEGFVKLMGTSPEITGPVNLGNAAEFSIIELARKVIDLTGSSSQVVRRPLPDDDPRQRRPNTDYAHKIIGWSPTIELQEGLRRTISYFESMMSKGLLGTSGG